MIKYQINNTDQESETIKQLHETLDQVLQKMKELSDAEKEQDQDKVLASSWNLIEAETMHNKLKVKINILFKSKA